MCDVKVIIIIIIVASLCSTAFDVQVDEDTVCGKCFRGLDQYPFASIYEYSKCEQDLFEKQSRYYSRL